MEVSEALEKMKQYLQEIGRLRQLPRWSQEYELWVDEVRYLLEAAFGRQSDENRRFDGQTCPLRYATVNGGDEVFEDEYQEAVNSCETALKSILRKYELLGTTPKIDAVRVDKLGKPKAFIAHGGESQALSKLKEYLSDLGVKSLVVEKEPSESRSVNEQVEHNLTQADCAIVLGTADDKNLRDGKLYPRDNVAIEIGRFQERFPNRTIYLLEEGASFPSNISEKVYERFTQDNMEKVFAKIARELTAFGILRALKPPEKTTNA